MELLVAVNPDPDSTLPYLVWVPLGADGLVFRVKDTWPRTKAIYCHPVPVSEWPSEPEIVERVALRSCARRGAAIDVVADRKREQRSQIVFTRARGRDMVFWQSPRTRKQARPDVGLPTARAAGIAELEIVVDSRERYRYRFAGKPVRVVTRTLSCGDYAIGWDSGGDAGSDGGPGGGSGGGVHPAVVAAVERKSLSDLVSSLSSGRLRFALAELASLPRAAVVVEERYSRVFAQDLVRPALVADGLAELQVRWPTIPIVFCDNRALAQEWTYRYLAAAHEWARGESAATLRIGLPDCEDSEDGSRTDTSEEDSAGPVGPDPDRGDITRSSSVPEVSTAQVRAWARAHGLEVPARGRLRPEIWEAWQQARPPRS